MNLKAAVGTADVADCADKRAGMPSIDTGDNLTSQVQGALASSG
jgi:hypothetical protein